MAENETVKRRIDLSVLDGAPRVIETHADVAANRKVASAVMAWCYPWDKYVTRAMAALTLGIQAGMISTLLDNIDKMIRESSPVELSGEFPESQP